MRLVNNQPSKGLVILHFRRVHRVWIIFSLTSLRSRLHMSDPRLASCGRFVGTRSASHDNIMTQDFEEILRCLPKNF